MVSNTVVEISKSVSLTQEEEPVSPKVVKKSCWNCRWCCRKKHAHKLTRWEIDYAVHIRAKSAFINDKKEEI